MGNSVENMHSGVGVQRVRMWRIQPFHSKIQKQLSIIKNTLTDDGVFHNIQRISPFYNCLPAHQFLLENVLAFYSEIVFFSYSCLKRLKLIKLYSYYDP